MQEPEEKVNITPESPDLDLAVSSAATAVPEATKAGASLGNFNDDEKSEGYNSKTTVNAGSQTVRRAMSLRASLQPGTLVKCTIEEVL